MKTIIYRLLNEIYMLIGKIINNSGIDKNKVCINIINILYKTKDYLENIYYTYCLKPKLDKQIEKERKIREFIIIYLYVLNSNNAQNKIKLLTYNKC